MKYYECTDKKVGTKLHAYELGLLNETEAEEFELHLMQCEHCFMQVKEFLPKMEFLVMSETIADTVDEEGFQEENSVGRFYNLKKKAIYYPTAVLAALALIFIFFYWFQGKEQQTVSKVVTVNLIPTRAGLQNSFVIQGNVDIVISFVYEGAETGKEYSITLSDENGKVVYKNQSFTGFDEYEKGKIIISHRDIPSGSYKLEIADNEDNEDKSNSTTQEFLFRLTEN